MELKLSDAFIINEDNPIVELRCKVYNLNPVYNEKMKSSCISIDGYMKYTDKVREYSKIMEITNALETAIDECIEEGILAVFSRRIRI